MLVGMLNVQPEFWCFSPRLGPSWNAWSTFVLFQHPLNDLDSTLALGESVTKKTFPLDDGITWVTADNMENVAFKHNYCPSPLPAVPTPDHLVLGSPWHAPYLLYSAYWHYIDDVHIIKNLTLTLTHLVEFHSIWSQNSFQKI